MYTTLISPQQLHALQQSGAPLMVFDCTFELSDTDKGARQFAKAHIPAARYVHLDQHLSAQGDADRVSGGRHPLPRREDFARTLARLGLTNDMQVVAYDRNGCNFAGRLWWMLQWLGHGATAVLDGGFAAWQEEGLPIESGEPPDAADEHASGVAEFAVGEPRVRLVSVHEVAAELGQAGAATLLDARGGARYRGEVEPLDPVAGHIPGALNRPFGDNFGLDGRFKPAAQLREELAALLPAATDRPVTVYCGSGVSAIPNVLALELAGYGRPALFAGSWSEWCSDPSRPIERG